VISFDELDFTESNIFGILTEGREISANVENATILETGESITVCVRFIGVALSTREVIEYIGDPKSGNGFQDSRTESDLETSNSLSGREYALEGLCLDGNPAWINWRLVAESCEVTKQ